MFACDGECAQTLPDPEDPTGYVSKTDLITDGCFLEVQEVCQTINCQQEYNCGESMSGADDLEDHGCLQSLEALLHAQCFDPALLIYTTGESSAIEEQTETGTFNQLFTGDSGKYVIYSFISATSFILIFLAYRVYKLFSFGKPDPLLLSHQASVPHNQMYGPLPPIPMKASIDEANYHYSMAPTRNRIYYDLSAPQHVRQVSRHKSLPRPLARVAPIRHGLRSQSFGGRQEMISASYDPRTAHLSGIREGRELRRSYTDPHFLPPIPDALPRRNFGPMEPLREAEGYHEISFDGPDLPHHHLEATPGFESHPHRETYDPHIRTGFEDRADPPPSYENSKLRRSEYSNTMHDRRSFDDRALLQVSPPDRRRYQSLPGHNIIGNTYREPEYTDSEQTQKVEPNSEQTQKVEPSRSRGRSFRHSRTQQDDMYERAPRQMDF